MKLKFINIAKNVAPDHVFNADGWCEFVQAVRALCLNLTGSEPDPIQTLTWVKLITEFMGYDFGGLLTLDSSPRSETTHYCCEVFTYV